MTGYQEIATDPSYAGEIVTFTFPHIANVGTNSEDIETTTPAVRVIVLRADITDPSIWRNAQHLAPCLHSHTARTCAAQGQIVSTCVYLCGRRLITKKTPPSNS